MQDLNCVYVHAIMDDFQVTEVADMVAAAVAAGAAKAVINLVSRRACMLACCLIEA
eukprot:COSAG01_NODE_1091_length_11743_cov_52.449244_3_plen_56_part_00